MGYKYYIPSVVDMESLGFESRSKDNTSFKFKGDKGTWVLFTTDGKVNIAINGGHTVFHGNLKDKAELEVLIKQLKINDTNK